MTKIPGNWMSVRGPLVTSVPPSIVVQKVFCASTSFTARWMWPSVTPRSFGGASCADAGVGDRSTSSTATPHRCCFFMRQSVYPALRFPDERVVVSRRVDVEQATFVVDLHIDDAIGVGVDDGARPFRQRCVAQRVEHRAIEEHGMPVSSTDGGPYDRRAAPHPRIDHLPDG